MRSATDFLPWLISTLTNLATSLLVYLGSGRISRLGISRRRGMWLSLVQDSSCFGFLGAILRAGLLAVLDARGVEAAAHHVIAHARQVLHTAAAGQDHRMLLQVVAFAADVADHLEAVGEPHLRDLAQCRVWFLRSRRVHARADAALLRALLERRHLALRHRGHPALAHQLIDRRHLNGPFRAIFMPDRSRSRETNSGHRFRPRIGLCDGIFALQEIKVAQASPAQATLLAPRLTP